MVTLTARYYGFSIVYYYSYAIVVVLLPVTQRKMNGREGVIYTYWHRFLGSGLKIRNTCENCENTSVFTILMQ